jgi:hypothetical protein
MDEREWLAERFEEKRSHRKTEIVSENDVVIGAGPLHDRRIFGSGIPDLTPMHSIKSVTLHARDTKRWRSRGMRARNIAVASGAPLHQRRWTWKRLIWP